jgi:hypothetical protein
MAIDEAVIAGLTATYDDHGVVFWLKHWAQSDEATRARGEATMRAEGHQ